MKKPPSKPNARQERRRDCGRARRPAPAGSRHGYSKRSKLSVPSYITESVTPMIVTAPRWTYPSTVTGSPVEHLLGDPAVAVEVDAPEPGERLPAGGVRVVPLELGKSRCVVDAARAHREAARRPACRTTAAGTAAGRRTRPSRGTASGTARCLDPRARSACAGTRRPRAGVGPGRPRRAAARRRRAPRGPSSTRSPSASSAPSSAASARASMCSSASRSGPANVSA